MSNKKIIMKSGEAAALIKCDRNRRSTLDVLSVKGRAAKERDDRSRGLLTRVAESSGQRAGSCDHHHIWYTWSAKFNCEATVKAID
jgi:hypothetical protein